MQLQLLRRSPALAAAAASYSGRTSSYIGFFLRNPSAAPPLFDGGRRSPAWSHRRRPSPPADLEGPRTRLATLAAGRIPSIAIQSFVVLKKPNPDQDLDHRGRR